VKEPPKRLLRAVGFVVRDVPEGHICCGSAGTYNILQPAIANQLRDRKIANIAKTRPQIIASGNIGCLTQIGGAAGVPVVHTVKLLDWATGGPLPSELAGL
jgi:glycolate oxidase iron-sulfur subunit